MSEKKPGYTKVDNKLLEALARSKLSGSELKIMLFLIRKLEGFHKVEDRITGVQIAEGTGIAKQHVSSKLKGLKIKNYIYRVKGKVGIKRAFGLWGRVTEYVTLEKLPNTLPKVTHRAEKKVTESGTSKEIQKKTPKKGAKGLKKLGVKEIEKMEGKKWLRQVMWQRYGFKEEFIDRIFREYSFMQCYDVFLALEEASNVRSKEAWVLAKLG